MNLFPFSKRFNNEFLSRQEDNFERLIEKLHTFRGKMQGERRGARRLLPTRFNYAEELKDVRINENGLTTEEVSSEFQEMLEGCVRQHDPMAAFNIFPSPLLDAVAGSILMSLYTPNALWDLLSGKVCLFEKKIVRMIGQLAGWAKADGYVVSGGKQALMYAIKIGIERARKNRDVPMTDFVVLTSGTSHFCIEHICHYFGLGAKNCLRIKTLPNSEIDLAHFQETMDRAVSEGKKIAAVIAVGGATINLVPDSILDVRNAIDACIAKHGLDYSPYLHVDAVISWVFLAFGQTPPDSWSERCSAAVADKISYVLSNFQGIEHADSFAADFHKTGFCPYAAGVFVVKSTEFLAGLPVDGNAPKDTLCWGESEIYRQTMENSRSSIGIAAIWISLRRLGLSGLREYVLYQMEVCEEIKRKLRSSYSDHFEVLSSPSCGWEIIIKPHFGSKLLWEELQQSAQEIQDEYAQTCQRFLNHLWFGDISEEKPAFPFIGFVKKYSRKGDEEKALPAFLIHPSSLHYDDEAISELLEGCLLAKTSFEASLISRHSDSNDAFLEQLVPPR